MRSEDFTLVAVGGLLGFCIAWAWATKRNGLFALAIEPILERKRRQLAEAAWLN